MVAGPSFLLCPHCGNDERSEYGPHEMFNQLERDGKNLPLVSNLHFRCRQCAEVSPVWVIRQDGGVTTHMRELETGEACMPQDFRSASK